MIMHQVEVPEKDGEGGVADDAKLKWKYQIQIMYFRHNLLITLTLASYENCDRC